VRGPFVLCTDAASAGQGAAVAGPGPPTIRAVPPWHIRCDGSMAMSTLPAPTTTTAPLLPRPLGYHGAVSDFKRRLIEATLLQMRGNRTHTARALGLQRTYLLRLIRELGVAAPPPPGPRRTG
jgi:DNA-binding NtrC family response regulator